MSRARSPKWARCGWALFALISLCPPRELAAQASASLSFADFLEAVHRQNLELQSSQHAVAAAEAGIAIAKVFPDPVLSGGLSQVDVSGQSAPLMSSLGLTLPIELGGKRAGRIAVAGGEVRIAQAELARPGSAYEPPLQPPMSMPWPPSWSSRANATRWRA